MKRILTILALVAFTLPSGVATQQATAQIDKSPWYGTPGTVPSGSADFNYPKDEHQKAVDAYEAKQAAIAQYQKAAIA